MQRDTKDLKKLVSLLRKNGIFRYKDGDFELELSKEPLKKAHREPETPGKDAVTSFRSWESLSEDQKNYWSSTPQIENG